MIVEKLHMLETSGVIGHEVHCFCVRVLEMLEADAYDDEEINDMFITHLAIAMERMKKGENVGTLVEDIWTQIVELPIYSNSVAYCEKICAKAPYEISQDERKYLIMHICKLMTAKEEKE